MYTIDYARGIDILRFDRDPGLRPSRAQLERSWVVGLGATVPQGEAERLFCRLGAGA